MHSTKEPEGFLPSIEGLLALPLVSGKHSTKVVELTTPPLAESTGSAQLLNYLNAKL